MSCTGQWTHQHHVHLLVPVLLSLDAFPYVSAANLVLLKLYSLVPSFPF